MRHLFLICILFLCVGPVAALAQTTTASITGTVADSTGAVIPDAQLTATNKDTGLVFKAKSNGQGEYKLDLLPVGNYSLQVVAPGFKRLEQSGILLDLGRAAAIPIKLDIGSSEQVTEVNEDAPLINTTNAIVGATVGNREIENLPIVNRNVYDLLNLVPGVQTNTTTYTLGYPQQTVLINGGISVVASGSTSYYLDGGTNMTGLRNTGNVQPNPDAVNEFRVETNNYSAEYGRFPNGVVSVITKSGGNAFHGSAFEFWRENGLNARDYNVPATVPLHRHQFGGTIGGPIKRDKTFFFFSYGGLRQITTATIGGTTVTPTAAQRTGDFSANLPTTSGTITTCAQTISAADKAAGNFIVCDPVTRKPVAGNKILSGLDPTVQNLVNVNGSLPYIPLPTGAGNTYAGTLRNQNNTNEALFKLDHSFSQRHRLTGEVFENSGFVTQSAGGNLPWSTQSFQYRQWNGVLADTFTFSPSWVNQAYVSFTRNIGGRINLPATPLSAYGSKFQVQGTPSLPQIAVSGYFTAGEAISGPRAGSNFYEFRDTAIHTRGKHSVRFGGSAALDRDIQESLLNNYGVFSFSASTTARSGNALSDFIYGLPATMNQDAPSVARMNSWYDALYVLDDWKLTPTFTLNLGLRWDYQTTPVDTDRQASDYRPGQQSTRIPGAPVGLVFSGDKGVAAGIAPNEYYHFSPRAGFAWDVFGNGRTSLRGGGGWFWGSLSGNECCGSGQPFQYRGSFTNVQSITNPYGNYAAGSPFPFVFDPANPRFTYPFPVSAVQGDFKVTSTYQSNLSVEQQWTKSFATTIGYVGSYSRHLPFTIDQNAPIYSATATSSNVDARRPIMPGIFQGINQFGSEQSANYSAFQVTANQRTSHNVSLRAYYVWAKNLESAGLESTSAALVDPRHPEIERGRADNDYRNTFVGSAVWLLDYYHGNRLLKAVANGWQLSPIVTLRSGSPFTVTTGTDVNLDGVNNDRPNLIGDPYLPHRDRNALKAQFFNPAAFATPAIGTDGNARRNVLDGPGYKSTSAAIFRTFAVERVQLQLRGEFTNLFNSVNLSNPTASLSSSQVGKIATAGAMRQTQLGLRLTF